jgi:NitT/TauT family transport system permease protein
MSLSAADVAQADPVAAASRRPKRDPNRRVFVHSLQLLILLVILAAWQWVPKISGIQKLSPVFNPLFISSPSRVASTLYDVATHTNGEISIWGPFERSVVPALIGTAVAIVAGALAGLICSNWDTLNRVLRPFIVVGNALPRITLIPIIVVIAGPTALSDMIVGFMVVFFLVFWNAYEGGISVPTETLENMRILGANRSEELRRVRLPYVLVWTFASLPAAIGFGLTAIVTAELFTGSTGLGQVLVIAVQTANGDLTVAVTLLLGITGLILIGGASMIRGRVLHWWG